MKIRLFAVALSSAFVLQLGKDRFQPYVFVCCHDHYPSNSHGPTYTQYLSFCCCHVPGFLAMQAETLEDLHEWKAALEEALSNAPNAALVMGQNGIFKNDQLNAADVSSEQCVFLTT